MSVEKRLIPSLLAHIDVHPSLPVDTVHLGPDVVLAVPYPAHPATDRSAKHAEAIGPFTHTTPPGLQEDKGVVVPWESLEGLAMRVRALVEFHSGSTTCLFLINRSHKTHSDRLRIAPAALWVVDPLEIVALEPPHERNDYAVLVSPGCFDIGP